MDFKDLPIKKKLIRGINLISTLVLVLTCTTFISYEFYKFRETTTEKLSTIAKIIANNGTAALAFGNQKDAEEILFSLSSEPNIAAACFYDKGGLLFSEYNSMKVKENLPKFPGQLGFRFLENSVEGFTEVKEGDKLLGTLFIRSNLGAMYDRFLLYGIITSLVVFASLVLSYILSRNLEKSIAEPILALSETSTIITHKKDYSVRAKKFGQDEIGNLTDAFNQMLEQIESQNKRLSDFNQQLEQKVIDRTKELAFSNKELGEFAYIVSHDLKAPLRAIASLSAFLEEDYKHVLDENGKSQLKLLVGRAQRMNNLIEGILEYSRLGRAEKLVLETVNLNDTLAQVLELIDPPENIDIKIENSLPTMIVDAIKIQQVFQNLISNAIKYMDKEHGVIRIGVMDLGNEWRFFVSDNGPGIEEKYFDKIFQIFQTLSSRDDKESTGIGLTIVKKIIETLNGKIWLESDPGIGSSFYFTIPKILEKGTNEN